MKSNEEFIAGIYEKAATYTEEKETKIIKVNWVAKAIRIAAMAAVCIGLAGVGAMTLDKNSQQIPGEVPSPSEGNYGIALTSEQNGEPKGGESQLRVGAAEETVTFTGVVESIDAEEKRIWIKLVFDENAPTSAKDSVVCIKWDVLEEIGDKIQVGTKLTAIGALSQYVNETSVHNGCAELVLTDLANLEIK